MWTPFFRSSGGHLELQIHLCGLHLQSNVVCSPCGVHVESTRIIWSPCGVHQNHLESMWSPPESSGVHVESTRIIWSSCGVHQNHLESMWSPPGIFGIQKLTLIGFKKNVFDEIRTSDLPEFKANRHVNH